MDRTRQDRRPLVVGIAGGSGSGKSTVVREVVRLVGPELTAIITHDAYYRDLSHLDFETRKTRNFDHPDALETEVMVADLRRLLGWMPVEVPVYDYATHTRTSGRLRVEPAAVLIVEGILVLAEAGLRDLMDLRVFVDVGEDERLRRRAARDQAERGRTGEATRAHHRSTVQPMHDRFVEPSRAWANVLIPAGGHNVEAIEALAERVRRMLTS